MTTANMVPAGPGGGKLGARLRPRPGSSRPPPGSPLPYRRLGGGGDPGPPLVGRPQDLGGNRQALFHPRPHPHPRHFFCLLYSFDKRFISSRPLRNVRHLLGAFCLGRGLGVGAGEAPMDG